MNWFKRLFVGGITIRVTQDHIDRGMEGNINLCPIAQAIRACTEYPYAWVGSIKWYTSVGGESMMLPRKARRFIKRFDAGKPVKPFSFKLRSTKK